MDHFKRSKIPRPPDVLIPIWTEGQDTAIYVTVVNPLQQALVARASEEGDFAVAHALKEKLRKYEARCSAEAITILPLAVDSFGGWHKVGLKTITRLGRQLARNLGKDEDDDTKEMRQCAAVCYYSTISPPTLTDIVTVNGLM